MNIYPANVLSIPHATESQTDAAQYMIRHKQKQYNLCGQFCVAFCMSDNTGSKDIDEFLNYWEAQVLKWYQSAFRGGLSRTTGIYDLEAMLSAYGIKTPCARVLFPYMPRLWSDLLKEYQVILGVHIDHTGYLVGKGIPHWIVLDDILVVNDSHAICKIYNPFTNAFEPYSWRELMNSTGAYKQGIWVNRFTE